MNNTLQKIWPTLLKISTVYICCSMSAINIEDARTSVSRSIQIEEFHNTIKECEVEELEKPTAKARGMCGILVSWYSRDTF